MPENEAELIRLVAAMETLTDTVKELTGKFESMKDDRVVAIETKAAVMEEKVSRLSWVVYSTAGALFLQILAVIASAIKVTMQ